jgi:hypothetical protein
MELLIFLYFHLPATPSLFGPRIPLSALLLKSFGYFHWAILKCDNVHFCMYVCVCVCMYRVLGTST